MEELKPRFEMAKSFYRKAFVHRENGKVILFSYDYPIAQKNVDTQELEIDFDNDKWCSHTTLRHIKEFYYQFIDNSKKITKSDLEKMKGMY